MDPMGIYIYWIVWKSWEKKQKMMVKDDLFLYVPVKTAIKWGVPHFQTDPYVLPLKYCMNPSEPTQLINQQTGAPAWSSLLLCFEVVTTQQWIVIHIDPKHWYGSWVTMVYPQNMIQQYPTYPCEIGERDCKPAKRKDDSWQDSLFSEKPSWGFVQDVAISMGRSSHPRDWMKILELT